MPDPELLPPGRSIDSADPSPAGIPAVLKRAAERRRVKAASVGATALASVAVVFAVIASGGATDALNTVDPPAGRPAATSTPGSATTAPSAPVPGVAIPPVESLVPKATVPPNTVPTTLPTSSPAASPAAPRPNGEVGPPMQITTYDVTRKCDGSGPTAAQGWCSFYDGATSGRAGQSVELAAALCRIPGQGTGKLDFASGMQLDFAVGRDTYPASWKWSSGHHFSSTSPTVTVPEGKCARWHVTWTVTDDKGRPLAPGDYYLDARPATTGSTTVETQASETFTVSG